MLRSGYWACILLLGLAIAGVIESGTLLCYLRDPAIAIATATATTMVMATACTTPSPSPSDCDADRVDDCVADCVADWRRATSSPYKDSASAWGGKQLCCIIPTGQVSLPYCKVGQILDSTS